MIKLHISFFIFFLIAANSNTYAQSCCGRVALPAGGVEQRPLLDGQYEFRLSYENSYLGKTLLEGDSYDDPFNRNNKTNFLSLSASYGIADRISGVVVVPFKWTRLSLLDDRVIRKTSGLGDLTILGKYRVLAPISPREPEFAVGLGIKLPTGSYEESDYFGVMSASQQVGSGAFDLIFSTYYSQLISKFNIFSSGIFRYPTRNDRGYQFGEEFEFRVSAVFIGINDQIAPTLGFHSRVTNRASFDGSNLDSYGGGAYRDSGGEWIYINPGFELRLSNLISVNSEVSFPVYNRNNGIQISETFIWRIATSFSN